jgi:DNA-binding MarR family transcriptional regulator
VNLKTRGQKTPGEADPRDVLYPLLHAAQAVERKLEEALAQVGLSGPKYAALTVLVQTGEPISLSELAKRLTCVRSNITQLVDRLENDGLVRRVDDPADRRGKRAQITPLGLRRQAVGERQVAKVQGELAKAVAGLDQGTLAAALSALR